MLHKPSLNFIDDIFINSDRANRVILNLEWMSNTRRLAGAGYLSILPVDQGIEHSAVASFAPNPLCFDPKNIVKLAIEADCNGVVSTLGVLGIVSRRYAHKISFVVKIKHNELSTYPNTFDKIMFALVEQAYNMGGCWYWGNNIFWFRRV